jgi:hypothetical protein
VAERELLINKTIANEKGILQRHAPPLKKIILLKETENVATIPRLFQIKSKRQGSGELLSN